VGASTQDRYAGSQQCGASLRRNRPVDGKNLDEWVSAQDKSPANGSSPTAADCGARRQVSATSKPGGPFETISSTLNGRSQRISPATDQARGNSGVFLASTGPGDAGYELQVLDSYNNKTYVNGQAGSIYKQGIPLVNPIAGPGNGRLRRGMDRPHVQRGWLAENSCLCHGLLNGMLVQNHFELKGQTLYIGHPFYKKYGTAPINAASARRPQRANQLPQYLGKRAKLKRERTWELR